MKLKLKIFEKQPEKDFISKVQDNLNEVKSMLSEANGIKEVLERYEKEKSKNRLISIEYKEGYFSDCIVRIKMDDLMVEYLKDRLGKIEKEIKERVVSNETI